MLLHLMKITPHSELVSNSLQKCLGVIDLQALPTNDAVIKRRLARLFGTDGVLNSHCSFLVILSGDTSVSSCIRIVAASAALRVDRRCFVGVLLSVDSSLLSRGDLYDRDEVGTFRVEERFVGVVHLSSPSKTARVALRARR